MIDLKRQLLVDDLSMFLRSNRVPKRLKGDFDGPKIVSFQFTSKL